MIDSLSLGTVFVLVCLGWPEEPDQRDKPKLVVRGAIHEFDEVLDKKVTLRRNAVDIGP